MEVRTNVSNNSGCLYARGRQILQQLIILLRIVEVNAPNDSRTINAHSNSRLVAVEYLAPKAKTGAPLDVRTTVLIETTKECIRSPENDLHVGPESLSTIEQRTMRRSDERNDIVAMAQSRPDVEQCMNRM